MKIAFIGLGEVGRTFAAPFHQHGHELLLCERQPSAAAAALAEGMGARMHAEPGPWLEEADWTFSCVIGSQAQAVASTCARHQRRGSAIADFTTASPENKRGAAASAARHGVGYIDTAIMGAVSLARERTPLLASGDRAGELKAIFDGIQGRMEVIEGGQPGDAIALKILRSVFTKGMEALSVELLMAAERQGVRGKLPGVLADIDRTPLRDFIDMLVRTHVVHAARRAHEVEQAAEELASHGLPSRVLGGIGDRFRATATQLQSSPLPQAEPTTDQAVQWLLAQEAPHTAPH